MLDTTRPRLNLLSRELLERIIEEAQDVLAQTGSAQYLPLVLLALELREPHPH